VLQLSVLQADEGKGTSPVVQGQEAVDVDQSPLVSSVPMARNEYTASSALLERSEQDAYTLSLY